MTDLSQPEIDHLLVLEKRFVEPDPVELPGPGETIVRDLESLDATESFVLDIDRSAIRLTKQKIQGRARRVYPLLRLCIGDTRRHRNPDGKVVVGSHLHIRNEPWGDRHAIPVPDAFTDVNSLDKALSDFLNYFNVVGRYTIEPTLFFVQDGF